MLLLLAASVVIPLGLDLYLPVPEDNPITAEQVAGAAAVFRPPALARPLDFLCHLP